MFFLNSSRMLLFSSRILFFLIQAEFQMQYPNRKFKIQNAICNNIHEENTTRR